MSISRYEPELGAALLGIEQIESELAGSDIITEDDTQ
jgi:hypothetical protein